MSMSNLLGQGRVQPSMATNQRSARPASQPSTEPVDGAGMAHPTVVPTNFEPVPADRAPDDE